MKETEPKQQSCANPTKEQLLMSILQNNNNQTPQKKNKTKTLNKGGSEEKAHAFLIVTDTKEPARSTRSPTGHQSHSTNALGDRGLFETTGFNADLY